MSISDEEKIDLNQIVSEFIQYVNEESADLSTDPNIVKVKVNKVDPNECPSCSRSTRIKSDG